jgi:hypothetical protein
MNPSSRGRVRVLGIAAAFQCVAASSGACTERRAAATSTSTTTGEDTPASGPDVDSGEPTGSASESTSSEPALPAYPDCRQGAYGAPGESLCEARLGPTNAPAWDEFACGTCVCAIECEHDDDCAYESPAARPVCSRTDGDLNTCVLVCEADADCPDEMLCFDTRWDVRVCQWPFLRPDCCSLDVFPC